LLRRTDLVKFQARILGRPTRARVVLYMLGREITCPSLRREIKGKILVLLRTGVDGKSREGGGEGGEVSPDL